MELLRTTGKPNCLFLGVRAFSLRIRHWYKALTNMSYIGICATIPVLYPEPWQIVIPIFRRVKHSRCTVNQAMNDLMRHFDSHAQLPSTQQGMCKVSGFFEGWKVSEAVRQ